MFIAPKDLPNRPTTEPTAQELLAAAVALAGTHGVDRIRTIAVLALDACCQACDGPGMCPIAIRHPFCRRPGPGGLPDGLHDCARPSVP
jgi:hypothetical protein